MSKIVMLRLPDSIAETVQRIADRKGLGVSTAIREIVCEHLNAPVQPSKAKTSAASTPERMPT